MVLCALFAALLCLCAWIGFPFGSGVVTLQTLGVFLTLGLLGGKLGTAAIAVYLFMGAAGLPVFSGFRGGFGVLLDTTGGYLWGFLASGLLYWLLTSAGAKPVWGMLAGLAACYALGSWWFCFGYLQTDTLSLGAVLLKCVVPYLLPDGVKLALAVLLTKKIRPLLQ